jgi:HD superfamily phosphohydrolase
MEELNQQFVGKLNTAIAIFKDDYPKHFLHQLVSGQLDMDRMDYLSRDAFYTGVSEGVIGYDRIIKMLNVVDGDLVVEEKGIYSIENFLIARRIMYWQVYLHKTVLSAELMLMKVLKRAKELANTEGYELSSFGQLDYFLKGRKSNKNKKNVKELIERFAILDDFDIIASLKLWSSSSDFILSCLSRSILNRRLFKTELQNEPFSNKIVEQIRLQVATKVPVNETDLHYLVFTGTESNQTYNKIKDEIKILSKNQTVNSITEQMDYELHTKIVTKHYLCYLKYF